MTVGPVNWGSYPGETLELVMAVLLGQERPASWRRSASQGDGGIDVIDPVSGGYEIYQIKRFSERLTNNQKTQIKDSLTTAKERPRLDKPITHWFLVLPLDPTSEDEAWFRTLTTDAPFQCTWLGRTFWDSEASKYPYVIDYYLRDGKGRLLERVKTLTKLLADPESPARPADVVDTLRRLHQELNAADPHYRYDISITNAPPTARAVQQGLIMSQTIGAGESFVTIDVIARFREALVDRPIGGSLSFVVQDPDSGIDLTEEVRLHTEYGRGLSLPEGALTKFTVDAPGGLGGEFGGGLGVLGPASLPLKEPHRLELELLAPDDSILAAVSVPVADITKGSKGIEITGTEPSGAFDFECRIDQPDPASGHAVGEWGLRQRKLAGLHAKTALPAIQFMARLTVPYRLRTSLFKGPARAFSGIRELDETESQLINEQHLAFAEHLAELQAHTSTIIALPELVSAEEIAHVAAIASILRGESFVTENAEITWVGKRAEFETMRASAADGTPFRRNRTLTVILGGAEIQLGTESVEFTDIHIESEEAGAQDSVKATLKARVKEQLPGP
jgi:hypothetical protein